MNKKINFVLHVTFNGHTKPFFNCCGLKEATIEEAIEDGIKIFNKNKKTNKKYKAWKSAKATFVTYTILNDSNHVVGHGKAPVLSN